MAENREAFRRWRIVPRMLRDVSERDLSTTVLGTPMPAPLMLAPIGVQKIVHDDGELASARAAAALGLPFVASTASHYTMEEIAEASGDGPRWFQLYWPNRPELAESFVRRAEAAGYAAIVLTVDTFIPGWKPRDLQQAWLPFLEGSGNANFFQDPVFRAGLERPPEEDLGAATAHYLDVYENPQLDWDDLSWLRGKTSLPIVIKGIQHVDDAREAAERGVDGIIVSNHGGRQVDGAIASIDALPAIADAVGGDLAVLFDSGIRGGADVLKALALGADAVLLGRPYIWGLALDGQSGRGDGAAHRARRARPDAGAERLHPPGAAQRRGPGAAPGLSLRRIASPAVSGIDRDKLPSLLEAELAEFIRAHPRSRELYERSLHSLVGGVPMPWMMRWAGGFPVFAAEASGARITDVDDHTYIDLCLGDTGAMTGHSPPVVAEAVARQARKGITTMLPTEDSAWVGEEMARRFGVHHWLFTLTATDANRAALRICRQMTGRRKVLAYSYCYHGSVDETFAVATPGGTRSRAGNAGPPVDPAETTVAIEFNDLDALERALETEEIACVLAEPAMTNMGIILPDPGYHEALRELTPAPGRC